jgi:glycosyltransferase involved in cell wall biosynthesis
MKIAVLTDGISPFVMGGMQKHSNNLVKHLVSLGHQVTLVHCVQSHANKPTKEEVLEALEIADSTLLKLFTLRFPKAGFLPGHYLKESYQYSRMIYDLLKEEWNSFDFIYSKGFTAWHLLSEKQKNKKSLPPIGVKFHGYEMFQPTHSWKSKLEAYMLRGPVKWINQHADVVFSYGGKITDIIKDIQVPSSRILEIPTGIDPHWIRSKNTFTNTPLRFVFVGRYERRKGIDDIHRAIQLLPAELPFQMTLVGPIPASVRIKDQRVHYTGALSSTIELQNTLDAHDVLLIPSHSEGMPNVIMEAMARGLAIVATDVGAVRSVVDESMGWFVNPADPKGLSEMMARLISMKPAEIDDRKRNALKGVAAFIWPNIAMSTAKGIEPFCHQKPI